MCEWIHEAAEMQESETLERRADRSAAEPSRLLECAGAITRRFRPLVEAVPETSKGEGYYSSPIMEIAEAVE